MPSSLVNKMRTIISQRENLPGSVGTLAFVFETLAPEQVMVVLSEAMRFVANVLQKPQGGRVPAQANGFAFTGAVDFFVTLGQRKQNRRLDAQNTKRLERRI